MSKPTLEQIQRGFRNTVRIFDPASSIENPFLEWIREQEPLSRQERASIYTDAWWIRLSGSLAEDYPALQRVLGDEKFYALVRAYLEAYPSRSYTLAKVGDFLPEFIDESAPLQTPEWLSDLARFERSYYQSYLAKDTVGWILKSENVTLKTESSTHLLASDWALHEVWNGVQNTPSAQPHFYVLYRSGFEVEWMSVQKEQFELLSKIEKKITLEEIFDFYPDEQAVHWITDWAQKKIICLEQIG